MHVEFARTKENLLGRWCTANDISGEFAKLCQLTLLEEFKGCLSAEIKTYLDEKKAEDLHQAAIWADDYELTYKGVFKYSPDRLKLQTRLLENTDQYLGNRPLHLIPEENQKLQEPIYPLCHLDQCTSIANRGGT